jgi:hypothetical protein
MFELREPTKAKLLDLVVLSQKNRQPNDKPGAKLTLEMALPNHALSHFDGFLKGMLFVKATGGAQGEIEGVEAVSDMPSLSGIGAKVGTLKWQHDMSGYELVVDLGTGGKRSNLDITDCALSGWRLTPKEGGTVIVKLNVESQNVSEAQFGKLATLKSREISITLVAPEVHQEDLAGQ